jgi:thioredoxin-like negative regulator of GroEL
MDPMGARWLLVALLAALAISPAPADGVSWHGEGLPSAFDRARQEDKLVLVDAWADWCRYCHVMDEQLWPRPDVAEAVAAVAVPVKIEVDERKGVGSAFRQRYGIGPLPVVLLLDPEDGSELARVEGAVSPDRLRAALRAARLVAAPERELAQLPPEPSTRLEIARRLLVNHHPAAARIVADSAAAADADCSRDLRDDAALVAAEAARVIGEAEAGLDGLERAARACLGADRAGDLWRRALEAADRLDHPDRRRDLLAARAKLRPGDTEAHLEWARWLIRHDRVAEAERVLAEAAERAPEDPGPLAGLAEIAVIREKPARALELIERAIALAPFDEDLRARRLEIRRRARER